ncbi:MAG: diaminopimelate decarboxylase, partial [Rubrivivax sp.]
MSLPGSPYLARSPGSDAADTEVELRLDGCSLDALARRFGTPLFVYSQRAVCDAASAYLEALAGRPHLLCYAMKANSNLALLQTLVRAGCGFDIVSGGELERALAVGADASRIVFSGVGKTRAEMTRALHAGVRCFNVESEAELDVLSEQA